MDAGTPLPVQLGGGVGVPVWGSECRRRGSEPACAGLSLPLKRSKPPLNRIASSLRFPHR